jgi:hypothetical protein
MNTETLDRLEVLLAKAAEGPWHVVRYGDGDSLVVHDAREDYRVCFMATPGSDEGSMRQIEAHAELIAEMRTALTELIAIARRAADVEGICRMAHDTFENDDDSGGGAYMRLGKAVSRHILGDGA